MSERWRDTYDSWKLATPPEYEITPEQERAMEDHATEQQACLRSMVAAVLADERQDIYLADVRRIVIEELNKLQPLPGEPTWQTATPVPVPPLG